MKQIAIILFSVFFISGTAFSQDAEKPQMKTYTFVMLKKGLKRYQDSLAIEQIQKGHMAHLNQMAESGDLNVAGPFLDNGNWRGILIFNSTDTVKIKQLVESDPAVKSGRLSYELHPWMTQQGSTFK